MPECDSQWRLIRRPPIELEGEDYISAMVEAVLMAHVYSLKITGGFHIERPNEAGVVASVVQPTFSVIFGSRPRDRFSDIFDQVGYLVYHLAKRHPFADGNKRTSVLMALALLKLYGIELDVDDTPEPDKNALYQWIASLVTNEIDEREFADRLRTHAIPSEESR